MNLVQIWTALVDTEDISHAFAFKDDLGDEGFKVVFKSGKELKWTKLNEKKINFILEKLMSKTTLLDLLG